MKAAGVFTALAVLALFLVAELAFRVAWFDPALSVLQPSRCTPLPLMMMTDLVEADPDPVIGVRLKKGARGTFQCKPFSTNAFGARGADIARDKPQGVTRIAVLGRSFDLGQGVGDDETWPAQLEARLRAAGHNVEVMNFALVRQVVARQVAIYHRDVAPLAPDMVLLTTQYRDLVLRQRVPQVDIPYVPPPSVRRALRGSFVYALLRHLYADLNEGPLQVEVPRPAAWLGVDPDPGGVLGRFAVRLRADGVRLMMLHAMQLEDDPGPEPVKRWCEAIAGCTFLPTRSREQVVGDDLAYAGEYHPNAAAQARYADEVFRALEPLL